MIRFYVHVLPNTVNKYRGFSWKPAVYAGLNLDDALRVISIYVPDSGPPPMRFYEKYRPGGMAWERLDAAKARFLRREERGRMVVNEEEKNG